MNLYFYKNEIRELPYKVRGINRDFTPLTDEQVAFYKKNPKAKPHEVKNMSVSHEGKITKDAAEQQLQSTLDSALTSLGDASVLQAIATLLCSSKTFKDTPYSNDEAIEILQQYCKNAAASHSEYNKAKKKLERKNCKYQDVIDSFATVLHTITPQTNETIR